MHSRLLQSVTAFCLFLLLTGCSNDGLYEVAPLPPGFKSATLHVEDGKGVMKIEYQGSSIVAEGKIEERVTMRSFSLVRDSADDQFLRFDFIWEPETNAWVCPDCVSPKGIGRSPLEPIILWIKK